jgi:alkylation response protein AidB-like acyl-CoA dehydrogenase
MKGEKFICLAISEAFAGSDVSGLRCEAKKSQDGKTWVINGTKKWITGGVSLLFSCFLLVFTRESELILRLFPRARCMQTTLLLDVRRTAA